jgi:hypothetical protein
VQRRAKARTFLCESLVLTSGFRGPEGWWAAVSVTRTAPRSEVGPSASLVATGDVSPSRRVVDSGCPESEREDGPLPLPNLRPRSSMRATRR